MIDIIYYYTLFSLTTSIYCWFKIFRPLTAKLNETHEEHLYLKKPILSSLVFLVFITILSPVFFMVVLSDNVKEALIEGMYEGSI